MVLLLRASCSTGTLAALNCRMLGGNSPGGLRFNMLDIVDRRGDAALEARRDALGHFVGGDAGVAEMTLATGMSITGKNTAV